VTLRSWRDGAGVPLRTTGVTMQDVACQAPNGAALAFGPGISG
jgi:hypothetical protein